MDACCPVLIIVANKNKNQHLRPPSAALIFADGEILWGYGFGSLKAVVGELCFNTSQTGYQETLTDPSYAKQIITFTFPHIGITGTNSEDLESDKIFAEGCIINQPIGNYSNWIWLRICETFWVPTKPSLVNLGNLILLLSISEKSTIKFSDWKERLWEKL